MIAQTISYSKILEKPHQTATMTAVKKNGGQVGEGGMGIVNKAHDTKLDCRVALTKAHPFPFPPSEGGNEKGVGQKR